MHIKASLIALSGFAFMSDSTSVPRMKADAGGHLKANADVGRQGNTTRTVNPGGNAFLQANLIQTGSKQNGFDPTDTMDNLTSAASATDDANFVNFCEGTNLTNGLVITEGESCNGIPMGARSPPGTAWSQPSSWSPRMGRTLL